MNSAHEPEGYYTLLLTENENASTATMQRDLGMKPRPWRLGCEAQGRGCDQGHPELWIFKASHLTSEKPGGRAEASDNGDSAAIYFSIRSRSCQ